MISVSLSESGRDGIRTQGACTLDRLPTDSRLRSGCPSNHASITSTRIRTRNTQLEAGRDFRFTIEAIRQKSGRQGIRTLISLEERSALAVRSGQPYPATFQDVLQVRVDPPGVEPGSPPCHSGIVPLDHGPVIIIVVSGPPGS